jgi:hypothetical protein
LQSGLSNEAGDETRTHEPSAWEHAAQFRTVLSSAATCHR